MPVGFDTLEYAKELEAAGFTAQQAEVQARALARIVDERLATKQDISMLQREIKELELRLTNKIEELELRLTDKISELELRLTDKISELELRLTYKLTLRMGAMLAASVGVIAAPIRIL